jgi:hypothetical protein
MEGREATLATLVAQGFTGEEAPSVFGRQGYDGALDSLVAQGVDPRRASSEFAIHCAAKRREAGNSKFLGGCNRAMYSGELCIHHQPIKAEKNDRCRGCGHVSGVETGERDLCQPCYRKPEATVARKAVVAEKEAA